MNYKFKYITAMVVFFVFAFTGCAHEVESKSRTVSSVSKKASKKNSLGPLVGKKYSAQNN